jgi:5-methylcytosine-specific restriction enzyme B
MARVTGTVGDQFYGAAQRFIDAALRADDSLFTPGTAIWSLAHIDDLYRRFIEQPDLGAIVSKIAKRVYYANDIC